MKKRMKEMHHKIDIFSTTLFLYCCGVLFSLLIFDPINNDILKAMIAITFPTLFCRRRVVFAFNHFCHSIFRFKR